MKAQFRYNGGRGALLCSGCKVILKTGDQFTEEEIAAIKGHAHLDPQYCLRCKLINALNESGTEWNEMIRTRGDIKYKVVEFQPPITQAVKDVMDEFPKGDLMGELSPTEEDPRGMLICAYIPL